MAVLSKKTVQRLAVLRVLSMWNKGAFGPVRVHKTLFFADKDADPSWHLFTFKRWRLGQYSDEIADSLNALNDASRISTLYDGPSERIFAELPAEAEPIIRGFFSDYFSEWHRRLAPAFKAWGYLTNDQIIQKAHADNTYTQTKHGQVILRSFSPTRVDFQGLDNDTAEVLSDLVDIRLQRGLATGIDVASQKRIVKEDWREIYFGQGRKNAKIA